MARVARLEAVSAQQAERADQTGRQLEKLQLRSRLMGRDLRPVLRQASLYLLLGLQAMPVPCTACRCAAGANGEQAAGRPAGHSQHQS